MHPILRAPVHLRQYSKLLPTYRIHHGFRVSLRNHATSRSPSPSPPSVSVRRPFWRPTFFALFTFLTWVPAVYFIWDHVFQVATVTGESMYPYLNTSYNSSPSKDRILLHMWKPTRDLRRGMLVAFWSPAHPEHMAVKRIVALEGDRVRTKRPYEFEWEDVPVGHVWVEGDNVREDRSIDSNRYGPLSKSLIVGKAVGVVWPLGSRGWIRWQDWRGSERVIEGANKVERPQFY